MMTGMQARQRGTIPPTLELGESEHVHMPPAARLGAYSHLLVFPFQRR
jgi:hypothetical protein